MEELFRPDDEVYTEEAVEIGKLFYDALKSALKEIREKYGDLPLRQLEYIALDEITILFRKELLSKMVRVTKEKRNQ